MDVLNGHFAWDFHLVKGFLSHFLNLFVVICQAFAVDEPIADETEFLLGGISLGDLSIGTDQGEINTVDLKGNVDGDFPKLRLIEVVTQTLQEKTSQVFV